MLKFFYSPGACSLTVHIALEEVGVPYEKEVVKTGEGTNSPAWKKINPKGYVPALLGVPGNIGGMDDLLTEANAILVYLGRKYPEARLLPPMPEGEARCMEWLGFLSGTVHGNSIAQIWRPERFVLSEKDYASVSAGGKASLLKRFDYIESLLADGRDWAVPDHYSVADTYLITIYRWGNRLELDMRKYAAWSNHSKRMLERPAVARVFEQEGISLE